MRITHKATVPGYGLVWFDTRAMTNIFSFANMAAKYRITTDTAVENCFVVHHPKGPIKFTKGPNNKLYYREPSYRTGTVFSSVGLQECGDRRTSADAFSSPITLADPYYPQVSFVETVEENKKFYTPNQIARAKAA